MRNRKNTKVLLLIILILGISIGFAALSTTLKINGNAGIAKNTWNIYWDNVANEKGVTADKPIISQDEDNHPATLVTWEVTFNNPGDFYEFTVDAVNAGTIDAMILDIQHRLNGSRMNDTNKLPDYINYSVTYEDGSSIALGDRLNKRVDTNTFTRKTYKVRVEFDKDKVTNSIINDMSDDGLTYELGFEVTYGQYKSVPSESSFKNDLWNKIAEVGVEAAKQKEVQNNICGPYKVGDTKKILMDLDDDGTKEKYNIRIANCSTPDICLSEGFSQSACGFVLEFQEVITTHRMNPRYNGTTTGTGSYGGWEYSDMRAYLNNGVYAYENIDYTTTGLYKKLPSDLRNNIVSTTIVSSHGSNESSNYITEDKLYLLSQHEVREDADNDPNTGLDSTDTSYYMTRRLDYYTSLGVTTDNRSGSIKKNLNGEAYNWWLRNITNNSGIFNHFQTVYNEGSWGLSTAPSKLGVSPAFKIG